MKKELQTHDYDHLIHAAAVADYHVESIRDESGHILKAETKIQSAAPLTLRLSPNPKIIRSVRAWSRNPSLKVISFKLTTGDSTLKLDSYDSEWIIHNDLKNVSSKAHRGTIYQKTHPKNKTAYEHVVHSGFDTKEELIQKMNQIISETTFKGEIK